MIFELKTLLGAGRGAVQYLGWPTLQGMPGLAEESSAACLLNIPTYITLKGE